MRFRYCVCSLRHRAAMLLAVFFPVVAALVISESAFGEPAFRWKDVDGTTFYGSKPPANAREIEKLSGKNFSRYSSSKLLAGYNPVYGDIAAPSTDQPITETNLITSPARLEEGKLAVNHNQHGQVTSCKVTVRNTGGEVARSIIVSFEFEDGSIIPGKGPESIAAKGEAIYFIDPANLPLTVESKSNDDTARVEKERSKSAHLPKPKVVIQSSPA